MLLDEEVAHELTIVYSFFFCFQGEQDCRFAVATLEKYWGLFLPMNVHLYILNMEQPKILVAIRKRPLSKKEVGKGENDIVSVKNGDTVIVSEYKYPSRYPGKK